MGVGALATWRHGEFLSHRFDLGNMVQAVWSTAHGRTLEVTDGVTGEQVVRLAAHADPILILLAPAWWVYPAPATLIVVQAAALASGLYPVVRLAWKHVASGPAVALIGVWYLLFPWVLWNAVNDVHPITLAIPLLLWAVWFLDEQRWIPFTVFAVLALSTGELVGLTVAVLGIWYAVSHRRAREGLLIALGGATWSAVAVFIVIPAARGGQPSPFYERFASVGGSPGGVLRTLFTEPGAIAAAMTSPADLEYLVYLLIPTGFLALGTPLLAAVSLPQLGVNMLSDFWSTTQPMFQYVAPTIGPLVAATIITIGRFPGRLVIVAAAVPFVASLACLVAVPPVPGGQDFVFADRDRPERVSAMREAIDLVPAGAPVTSTNRIGAHVSARRQVFLFPERASAEWVVLDVNDAWLQVGGERVDRPLFESLLRRFEGERSWIKVFEREGILVYRKRLDEPN